jgi:dTDP-4-amino-4,6-dideoxygalactose transaminase
MRARKRLDIGWRDLAFGIAMGLRGGEREALQRRLEGWWAPGGGGVAALSVRSGFDLLLQCLALPPESEVLVSAITIADMVEIIERHGLRAVPVDVEPASCAIVAGALEEAVTPRSRAILVSHLFGGRGPLAEAAAVARRHGLLLLEDCAQAFAADGYRGDPASDVAMFSFGPIKTATALGGAMLTFRDPALAEAVRQRQRGLPLQPRGQFVKRVLKFSALKALGWHLPYWIFVRGCALFGLRHDRVVGNALRGFAGGDLLRKIRHQPSFALLALLERRLRRYSRRDLQARIEAAQLVSSSLPGIAVMGARAALHTHWVFPILAPHPERLVEHLWGAGFDATRGASNLYVVPAPAGARDAQQARRAMNQVLFLPVDSGAPPAELRRLAAAVIRGQTPISPVEIGV